MGHPLLNIGPALADNHGLPNLYQDYLLACRYMESRLLTILGSFFCRDAFDAVYGASAGAINATYFLTGQRDGVDIYAEDIANKTFCDLGRLVGRNAGGSQPAL